MFEYFPAQYSWNLGVLMALQLGGELTEIDCACRSLKRFTTSPDIKDNPAAQSAWVTEWSKLALRLEGLAARDIARKNHLSASKKFLRASIYWFTADRMANHNAAGKLNLYLSMLQNFKSGIEHGDSQLEFMNIPYESSELSALYFKPEGAGPHPVMIHFDGFDVTKEWMYLSGMPREFAKRGIATLMVDHPGVGEALRLRGIAVNHDTEKWATAAIDFLEMRKEVEKTKIGIIAMSLGGYFAPRAAAFEKRLACCVAWGARWDNAGSHGRILRNPNAARSIAGWLDHALLYYGAKTSEEAGVKIDQMTLEDVIDKVTCPLLVAHGVNDRQVPLDQAEQTVRGAVNSPRADLRLFDDSEGSVEHCGGELFTVVIDAMADWVAEVFERAH